jgi:hypothetical protein
METSNPRQISFCERVLREKKSFDSKSILNTAILVYIESLVKAWLDYIHTHTFCGYTMQKSWKAHFRRLCTYSDSIMLENMCVLLPRRRTLFYSMHSNYWMIIGYDLNTAFPLRHDVQNEHFRMCILQANKIMQFLALSLSGTLEWQT